MVASSSVFEAAFEAAQDLGRCKVVSTTALASTELIRRLLQARTELERMASRLEEEVETRSEELRRKELQLARGEQLATIGTLAASVAHEINNPIAFVHSNLNRLDEMWDKDEERDEVSEILDECREGTERVRGIVSDLLRLSRSGDVRTEPVDLHETIAKALPLVGDEKSSPHCRLLSAQGLAAGMGSEPADAKRAHKAAVEMAKG